MKRIGAVPYDFSVKTACSLNDRIIGFDADNSKLVIRELIIQKNVRVAVCYTHVGIVNAPRGRKITMACCALENSIFLLVHTQGSLQPFNLTFSNAPIDQQAPSISSLTVTGSSSDASQCFQYSDPPKLMRLGRQSAVLAYQGASYTYICKCSAGRVEFFRSERGMVVDYEYGGIRSSSLMKMLCQPVFPSQDRYFTVSKVDYGADLVSGSEDSLAYASVTKVSDSSEGPCSLAIASREFLICCVKEEDRYVGLKLVATNKARTFSFAKINYSQTSARNPFSFVRDYTYYLVFPDPSSDIFSFDLYELAKRIEDTELCHNFMKIFPFACIYPRLPTAKEILPYYADVCEKVSGPRETLAEVRAKLDRLEERMESTILVRLPHLALPRLNLPAAWSFDSNAVKQTLEAEERHSRGLPQRSSLLREYRAAYGPILAPEFPLKLLAAVKAVPREVLYQLALSQVMTCVQPGVVVPLDHDLPVLAKLPLPRIRDKFTASPAAIRCMEIATDSIFVSNAILEQAPPCYRRARVILDDQDPLMRDNGYMEICLLRRVLQASGAVSPRAPGRRIEGAESAVDALRHFIKLSREGYRGPNAPRIGRARWDDAIDPIAWEWMFSTGSQRANADESECSADHDELQASDAESVGAENQVGTEQV